MDDQLACVVAVLDQRSPQRTHRFPTASGSVSDSGCAVASSTTTGHPAASCSNPGGPQRSPSPAFILRRRHHRRRHAVDGTAGTLHHRRHRRRLVRVVLLHEPLRDDADEHLLGARSRSSTRSSTSTAPARSSQRSSASPWRTDSTRIARWRPESCPAARWSCPTRPDDPTRGTAWVLSAEYEACSVAGRACTFVVGRRALGTSVDWLIVAPRLRDRVEASRNSIAMPGLFADQLRGGCQHCDTSARRGDRKAVRLGRSKVHCTVTVRTRRPALQSY